MPANWYPSRRFITGEYKGSYVRDKNAPGGFTILDHVSIFGEPHVISSFKEIRICPICHTEQPCDYGVTHTNLIVGTDSFDDERVDEAISGAKCSCGWSFGI